MNDRELDELRKKLQSAIPRLTPPESELRRDLWPQMLRKLSERPIRVPWFDWALLAALGASLFFFPAVVPALLYHL